MTHAITKNCTVIASPNIDSTSFTNLQHLNITIKKELKLYSMKLKLMAVVYTVVNESAHVR